MTKVEFKKRQDRCRNTPKRHEKTLSSCLERGKPFAAVIPICNADEETLALGTNRKFLKIIGDPGPD